MRVCFLERGGRGERSGDGHGERRKTMQSEGEWLFIFTHGWGLGWGFWFGFFGSKQQGRGRGFALDCLPVWLVIDCSWLSRFTLIFLVFLFV